jgi:hypothetical protein
MLLLLLLLLLIVLYKNVVGAIQLHAMQRIAAAAMSWCGCGAGCARAKAAAAAAAPPLLRAATAAEDDGWSQP